MPLSRFIELSRPFLEKAQIQVPDADYLGRVLAIVKEKIKLFRDVPDWTAYFFTELYPFDPAAMEKVFARPEAANRLGSLGAEFEKVDHWQATHLENTLKELAGKLDCKTGDLVHPARVAVSGRSVGPSLYHMLEVMGKDRVLSRFERMQAQLGATA
jgi:glutamyl-tRNA synthetase